MRTSPITGLIYCLKKLFWLNDGLKSVDRAKFERKTTNKFRADDTPKPKARQLNF